MIIKWSSHDIHMLIKLTMPFMHAMPFMQYMQCQLCIQFHLCNTNNAHFACNAVCAIQTMPIVHVMPFMQNTQCPFCMQWHLCNPPMLFKKPMLFMQSLQCQLCIQCHLWNSHNANYAYNAVYESHIMPIVHTMPFVV